MERPITEKARRCLSAERARGTKSSPRAEERKARREARSETGLQRSVKYDGAQPVTVIFDSCNNLLSSVHTFLENSLQGVRLLNDNIKKPAN